MTKASRRFLSVVAACVWCASVWAGQPYLVRDINTVVVPVHAFPSELMDQGTWSFFTAHDGVHGRVVWGTDGTAENTVRLDPNNLLPGGVSGYQTAKAGAVTYFVVPATAGPALWAANGPAQGARLIADAQALGGGSPIYGGAVLNDFVFFVYKAASADLEVWRSNGTA